MEKVTLRVPITVPGGLLLYQAVGDTGQQEISGLLLKLLPLPYFGWTINQIKLRKHPEVVVPRPPISSTAHTLGGFALSVGCLKNTLIASSWVENQNVWGLTKLADLNLKAQLMPPFLFATRP